MTTWQWRSVAKRSLERAPRQMYPAPRLLEPSVVEGTLGRFDTACGPMWLPIDAPDDVIVRDIRAGKLFEGPVIRTLLPFIRPGSAVLDVGANFGQMAIAFSDAVGSEGRVHAIEANDAVADLCERNVRARACKNVVIHRAAAWDVGGAFVTFPAPDFQRFGSYGSNPVDPTTSRGARVRTLAVDEITLGRPLSAIKVDVQGADLRALIGARATIARHKPAIIFEFEQQFQAEFATSFQDYIDFVTSIDYRFDSVILDINYLILPRTPAPHGSE